MNLTPSPIEHVQNNPTNPRRAKSYRIEALPQQYNTPAMRAVRNTLARRQMVSMIVTLTGEQSSVIWARVYITTQTTPASLDEALLIEYNQAVTAAGDE